jgi:hypothetical protein
MTTKRGGPNPAQRADDKRRHNPGGARPKTRDDDKRGGARVGSGPPPNFERTLALLERQIAHVEARRDVPAVELQIHAVRLHVLVSRLVELAGIE